MAYIAPQPQPRTRTPVSSQWPRLSRSAQPMSHVAAALLRVTRRGARHPMQHPAAFVFVEPSAYTAIPHTARGTRWSVRPAAAAAAAAGLSATAAVSAERLVPPPSSPLPPGQGVLQTSDARPTTKKDLGCVCALHTAAPQRCRRWSTCTPTAASRFSAEGA
jgi:hypothetical protein